MATEEGPELSVVRNDAFAVASMNTVSDIFGGFGCGHDQELRYGVFGSFPQLTLVVEQPNFGFDESRQDQGYSNAFWSKFDIEALGQGADCRFTHGVIDGSRNDGVSRNAADDGQLSA